jgi:DNA replication protein DnaC
MTWKGDVERLFMLLEELGEDRFLRLLQRAAYRAIQNGLDARFITADELIGDLSAAVQHGDLDDALEPYVHPYVLVIDELDYQSYASDAANVLFRVISLRHLKRRQIIVTTNKPLAALGQVLHDGDLAEAILDRLLKRGTPHVRRGRSYRTRHLKEDASTAAEDA